jgi:hypothetical protein
LVQEQASKRGIKLESSSAEDRNLFIIFTITKLYEEATEESSQQFPARVRFMLQTIYDLKNNKQVEEL